MQSCSIASFRHKVVVLYLRQSWRKTENDRVTAGRKKRIKLSHFIVDCQVSFLRNTSAIIYPTQSTADLDKAPGEGRRSISNQ